MGPGDLYMDMEAFFKSGGKTTIQEDVERQGYVESLLAIYSPKYVMSCFKIPEAEVQETLARCNPATERRRELEHMAGVTELMGMVVGGEIPLS